MAEIVLKDKSGAEQTYYGVDIIKLNTAAGEVQTFGAYDPAVLTPDKLVEGVTVGNVAGSLSLPERLENVPVTLDFSGGDQTITAPDGAVVKSAIIQKPETLTPENIVKDVEIAGIVGTHEGGGSDQPQLHAPSIAIADGCTLSITNPETNGDFVTGYKIFLNGVYYTTITESSVDLDTIVTELGDYTVTVICSGSRFADSESSNAVSYRNIFFSVSSVLIGCEINNDAVTVRSGSSYTATITPISGFKLNGASVSITMGETDVSSAYSNGKINIEHVSGDLSIDIAAVIDNKLNWTRMAAPSTVALGVEMMFDATSGTLYAYNGSRRSSESTISAGKTTDFKEFTALPDATLPLTKDYTSVLAHIAANGKIIFVTKTNIYVSSDEMKTWSTYSIPVSDTISGVSGGVYGNGKYVFLVRSNHNLFVCYSTDAVNWSSKMVASLSWSFTGAITFCNNKFFIVCVKNDRIYYSDDGVNYKLSSVVLPFYSDYMSLTPIAYGDGKYVIKGKNQEYITSTDGIKWVAQNKIKDTDCSFSIAYGNGRFVAVWNTYEDSLKDGDASWVNATADASKEAKDLWFIGNRFISAKGYYSDIVS